MSSDSSRKKRVRRRQEATGESYMRARRHLDGGGHERVPAGEIEPSESRLRSLLGLGRDGVPDVTTLWEHTQLPVGTDEDVNFGPHLRAPLGSQPDGSPLWLDLKDASFGGSGPHGLMIGTAGSGKSTALQSILFALCAQHHPEVLQLMLLSARKETVFTDFAGYPHTITIPPQTDYKTALTALIEHRTAALRQADAITLDRYLRAGRRSSRRALPPVPFTLVVIDEFSSLVDEDPRLVSAVDVLMRKGRRLGVHVLIVSPTVHPSWTVRIMEHSPYRIALRAETMEASRQLIGSAKAAELPSDRPGLGFYSSGPDGEPPVAFRGFTVSYELVRGVGLQLPEVEPTKPVEAGLYGHLLDRDARRPVGGSPALRSNES